MPTVRKIAGPYRLFFYSFDCNEPEHIHVQRERMLCKLWLDPVSLARNDGFGARELSTIQRLIDSNRKLILEAWYEHCD